MFISTVSGQGNNGALVTLATSFDARGSSQGIAQDFYLTVLKRPSLFLSLNLNT